MIMTDAACARQETWSLWPGTPAIQRGAGDSLWLDAGTNTRNSVSSARSVQLPHTNLAIFRARQGKAAIGGQGHGMHFVGMSIHREFLAGNVPIADGVIRPAREDTFVVSGRHQAVNRADVSR